MCTCIKKNKLEKGIENMKKMLLIIFLIITIVGIMYISVNRGIIGMYVYVDIPSLIIIIIPTIVMLIFADLMGDYVRAYKIAWGDVQYTTKELKASKEAMNLSIKLVMIMGIVGIIIGAVSSLIQIREVNEIHFYFAVVCVVLLTGLYAGLINLVQYSVLAKINKEIIYREN